MEENSTTVKLWLYIYFGEEYKSSSLHMAYTLYLRVKDIFRRKGKGVNTKNMSKVLRTQKKSRSGRRPIPNLIYVGFIVARGIFVQCKPVN